MGGFVIAEACYKAAHRTRKLCYCPFWVEFVTSEFRSDEFHLQVRDLMEADHLGSIYISRERGIFHHNVNRNESPLKFLFLH